MAGIRATDDLREMLLIIQILSQRMPHLADDALFHESVVQFLAMGGYRFIIAEDDESGEPCAVGIITFYAMPMLTDESKVLALEAMWFRDEALANQLWIWAELAAFAQRLQFEGLCVAEKSVNTPMSLHQLASAGRLGEKLGAQAAYLWLKGSAPGLYSAFAEHGQPESVMEALCLMIAPLVEVDWSGVASESEKPLYRGEGRLVAAGRWNCADWQALIDHFRQHGFAPRDVNARFGGTIPEQILQQGYIDQGTVSLTESLAAATRYAFGNPKRPRAEGVVFTIDRTRLRNYGQVYDSYASMRKYLDWAFASEFETLVTLVSVLGADEGGNFLETCARRTASLVSSGLDIVTPPPVWPTEFMPGSWSRLYEAGLRGEHLTSLDDTFRHFWMRAHGDVGAVDTIHVNPDGGEPTVTTRRVDPLGYYHAFIAVEERLKEALLNARADEDYKKNPGWQTTPFGYVAKTCQDQEFFSPGMVPGDCIVDAQVVTRSVGEADAASETT